jgi:hypothetical protein
MLCAGTYKSKLNPQKLPCGSFKELRASWRVSMLTTLLFTIQERFTFSEKQSKKVKLKKKSKIFEGREKNFPIVPLR